MTLLEKQGPSTASYSGNNEGDDDEKGYGYSSEVSLTYLGFS